MAQPGSHGLQTFLWRWLHPVAVTLVTKSLTLAARSTALTLSSRSRALTLEERSTALTVGSR